MHNRIKTSAGQVSACLVRTDGTCLYGHKRSNLNSASKKEQMVWVEKMRKCDCLTNVTGSI